MFSSSCFSVYVSINSLTPSFLYSDLNINIVIIKHKVSAIHPAYKTPNIPLFSANANISEIGINKIIYLINVTAVDLTTRPKD